MSVPRRRFGRTELSMPVFSCGGMRYQHSWEDGEAGGITNDGQQNLEATVMRALELGINHLETARGYGTSELQLGRLLPSLPREDVIVQTKIGPRDTAKEFIETFETSLSNLGVEYIDLLGVHGMNLPEHLEMCLKKGGTMDAVRQLQQEGRVKHVGFSTHGLTDLIIRTIETGEFDYVNLHWYFVNTVNAPAIEAAKRSDLGVFIISPNDKGGKLYAPPEKMVQLCDPLTPMAFNDLWCLCNEDIHTLSIGASRPSDFDAHIHALAKYDDREAVTTTIAARIHAEASSMLGEGWWSRWQEGIPDWHEIPGEVNVWEIMRLWNWAQVLDAVEFAKMRYNLLGQANHWFPGNNSKDFDGAAMKHALANHEFKSEVLEGLRRAHELLVDEPKKRLSES